VDDGLDYGARPLRRSVERFIEDPLSEELLRGTFDGQNAIHVSIKEVGDQKQLEFNGGVDEAPVAEAEATSTPA
jgi:ATP-dependent Clp protease ATP-binding subunit ClpC